MKAFFVFGFALLAIEGFAQVDTVTPPYKRFPTVPALQLILTDSTTKYTKTELPKKKPVVIMLFSPDCEHCQHEAEQIAGQQNELKDLHFVLVTTYPLYRIKEFAEKYGLNGLKNVVLAKDPYYLLIPFYDVRNFPYIALYNKKGKLVETADGSISVNRIREKLLEMK